MPRPEAHPARRRLWGRSFAGILVTFTVFWLTAGAAVGLGALYARLLGIAPVPSALGERQFMAVAALVTAAAAVLPLAARSRGHMAALVLAAATGGSLLAAVGWLAGGEREAALDWPGLLYLAQLLCAATVAGTAAGLIAVVAGERWRTAAAAGTAVAVAGSLLVLLAFWPQWTAQKRFESAAAAIAIDYFKLVAGFQVAGESPVAGEAATDFQAISALGVPGEQLRVSVSGRQERGFTITVGVVEGLLELSDGGKLGLPGWPDLDSPAARLILLDLVQSISVPRMALDPAANQDGVALLFRGKEMQARVLPPRGRDQPQPLTIIFTIDSGGFSS